MKIEKPWGFECILSDEEGYTFKVIRVKPGCRLSLQHHRQKHETVLVLSGVMRLELGSETFRLIPHTFRVIPAGVRHRIGSMGDEELIFAEAATGGLLHDVVRHEDDYGRV